MIRREALLLLLGTTACAAGVPSLAEHLPVPPGRRGMLAALDWLERPDFMMYDAGEVHALHYAEICCAHGALRLAHATRNRRLTAQVVARYQRAIAAHLPNTRNHVDANVFGAWPLQLAGKGEVALGLGFADGQWRETTPDGLTTQARYWIDDIWMIGALQIAAWRAMRRRIYLDRAALMARLYVAKLQQPNGLFHHGPDAPFFWGRGNGWVAAGLAEILAELPRNHRDYPAIAAGYRKMMAALLAHQAEDGMWHQLIDRPDAWPETSGTAMFGFALATGFRRGILTDATYGVAARKAWQALDAYAGPDGKLSNVCVGTGQSQDAGYYLARPTVTGDLHGQAALMWFAAEMVRP